MTEEEFFAHDPAARELYESLKEELVWRYPDMEIRVAKTQVSFFDPLMFGCVSFTRVKRKAETPAHFITLTLGSDGYLNFMGNEFGHPEWIDFPREGNGWSCDKARRRWSLRDDPKLQFSYLADWDEAMVRLFASDPTVLDAPAKLLACDGAAKVLAFARGRFVVLLNFHWRDSHADWPLAVPPGDYRLALDTDRPAFGGQGRIAQGQVFHAAWEIRNGQALPFLRVYLPSRTAMVLERLPRDPAAPPPRAPTIPKKRP